MQFHQIGPRRRRYPPKAASYPVVPTQLSPQELAEIRVRMSRRGGKLWNMSCIPHPVYMTALLTQSRERMSHDD